MATLQIHPVTVNKPATGKGALFDNGNITQNKLHTVTGNSPRFLVEQLGPPLIFLLSYWKVDSSVIKVFPAHFK
jgi:hypothetical protein